MSPYLFDERPVRATRHVTQAVHVALALAAEARRIARNHALDRAEGVRDGAASLQQESARHKR